MLVAPEHQSAGDAVVDYGLSDSRHAESGVVFQQATQLFLTGQASRLPAYI
jgi:hypothetical protein